MGDMKEAIHEENKKTKDPQEAAADEEGGDYYNLEVSFAYHAKPTGKSASSKVRQHSHAEYLSSSQGSLTLHLLRFGMHSVTFWGMDMRRLPETCRY